MLEDLDEDYRIFKWPVRITEFDIAANPEDPEQVSTSYDFTLDYYTALFSHPAVDGINAWGFWEPTMWQTGANGEDHRRYKAWYTTDWQITPIGQAFRDVVFKKYWTNASGTSNESGEYMARAFKGTHEIVATRGTIQNRMEVSFENDTTIVIHLIPDRGAPTQLQNLKATNTATTATLSWEPSTDNVKVIGYDVFEGQNKVNTSAITATSFKVTSLNQASSYSFTVVAKDTAGNVSLASEPVSFTTDSLKLYLSSVCSSNPLSVRRWEVKSAFDTTVVYRWTIKGTLQSGVDTVEANSYAYFETTNTGAANIAEITWQDPDGSIKGDTKEASWNYCPVTVRLDNDNYGKSQIYNYKNMSGFLAGFKVHTFFNSYDDIHYYTSPDGATWTEITVQRVGVTEDAGGGWSFARYAPQSMPAGTNYLKIEVVKWQQDWATYLDWMEITYDPTPEKIACTDCIEVVDKLDDWTKSYSHTNWYFTSDPSDPSLVARGSTGAESIVYNYKEMKDVAATLIYHATFPVDVKMYSSTDNNTFTEIAVDFTSTETSGGWFKN